MAKLRRQSNTGDFMSRNMDKRLSELEASISSIYNEAYEEAQKKLDRYLERYEEQYELMTARYLEEEITQTEYEHWVQAQMLRTQRYRATVESLSETLVNADILAMATVEGELPFVLAQSFNFTQFVGNIIAENTGLTVGTFQIYNTRSIQAIIRDNPTLLIPRVDIPRDQRWNRQHINRAISQGLINGDSMQSIAERLQAVVQMDDNAAIRNARTATTCAENLGRNESYHFIRSQGIDMAKEWSATHDSRTRDTHLLLDGTRPNEDGYFGEGILDPNHLMQYPADPNGEGKEIYNCRCRLNVVPPEYNRQVNEDNYRTWMRENYPDDYASIQAQDTASGREQRRQDALERQRRLREERRRSNGTGH